MKIVLIGFMGSGKTTVAVQLSKSLKLTLYEVDDELLKLSSQDSIKAIFESEGEQKFRELESKAIAHTANLSNLIISTGGGAVINPNNLQNLKSNSGVLIFLDADFQTVKDRVGEDPERPLFKDIKKANQLYEFRRPIYLSLADMIIEVNNKSVEQIVNEILISL